MAKPPKRTAVTTTTDASVTTRTTDPSSSHRVTTADLPSPGGLPLTGSDLSNPAPLPTTRPAAIVVHEMPGRAADSFSTARNEIAWPQHRLHELEPIGDQTGLFIGPDQRTYAQLGTEGRFVVERNAQGNYHVPLTFAPGVAGPLLVKNEGLASWRIERPGGHATQTPASTSGTAQAPTYLLPDDARSLTKAEASTDGLRYNKLKQTFVDTAEGTVRVRKNPEGQYQQAFATTHEAPEIFFERIPDSLLWRQKTSDSTSHEPAHQQRLRDVDESAPSAGPSKRPRLDEPTPASSATEPATPAAYSWLPWGHLNKPASIETVQLGWLHYPIVPIGSARTLTTFFVKHPDFDPAGFDAFEHMLRTAPSLQPVATFRIGHDPGEINPGTRFFDEPITQSVARAFPDLSQVSAQAIAKKLFELADNSPLATATGLLNIQAVLHQWKQKPFPVTPAYADPLIMLPVAQAIDRPEGKIIVLPPGRTGELQQLIFDPKRFAIEWNHYKTYPSDLNLRRLLGALLVRSGYDLYPLTHDHRKPTLVFRRASHDQMFFLKLGAVEKVGLVHQPGNELADPQLPDRIGKEAFNALSAAAAQNKVVWLIGGVLKVNSAPDSVFILKER